MFNRKDREKGKGGRLWRQLRYPGERAMDSLCDNFRMLGGNPPGLASARYAVEQVADARTNRYAQL